MLFGVNFARPTAGVRVTDVAIHFRLSAGFWNHCPTTVPHAAGPMEQEPLDSPVEETWQSPSGMLFYRSQRIRRSNYSEWGERSEFETHIPVTNDCSRPRELAGAIRQRLRHSA